MEERRRRTRKAEADESTEQQAERRKREALSRKVARDADDDNVQAMIERSIKKHGA